MNTTFTFNERTTAYAYSGIEYNRAFVKVQETDINMILKLRGYIYLNQIYETFGVEWKPIWKNLCYKYGPKRQQIKVSIVQENENGFDINIL